MTSNPYMELCCFSSGHFLKDEQNCVGMNCFEQNIFFTLKYEDLQRTNWVPVGVGIYDTGSVFFVRVISLSGVMPL